MSDLPPEVRTEAAKAVENVDREFGRSRSWRDETCSIDEFTRKRTLAVVDAVAAVVLPAHESGKWVKDGQGVQWVSGDIADRDRLKAENERLLDQELRLREQAGEAAEELERVSDAVIESDRELGATKRERDALKARVAELTAALTEINRRPCARQWSCERQFPTSRHHWCGPCIARAALSVGEEKS